MNREFWTGENISITASEYRKYIREISQNKHVRACIYTDAEHAKSILSMLRFVSGVIFQFEDIVVDNILDMREVIISTRDVFLNELCRNDQTCINMYCGESCKLNNCFVFEFCIGRDNIYRPVWKFSSFMDIIPDGLSAYRTVVFDNNTVLIVFSRQDSLERRNWRKIHQKEILIFLPPVGYGDFTILIPLLRDYFYKHSKCSFIMYTMGVHLNEIIYKIFSEYSIYIVNIPNVHFPNRSLVPFYYREVSLLTQYIEQIESSNTYNDVKLLAIDGNQLTTQSAYEVLSSILEVNPDRALERYQHYTTKLPILKDIAKLRKTKRYIIGLQYQSDAQNLKGERTKDWSGDNARRFLAMCDNEQIGVVNLVPVNEKDIIWDINADGVSILDLFTVIPHLDCVVSVDSVCGHIAGISGTNNLTIWSSKSYFYKPLLYAYRPVRKNYTIYTEAHLFEITPEIVFEKMNAILNGDLLLQKERFRVQGVEPDVLKNNVEFFCAKVVNENEYSKKS